MSQHFLLSSTAKTLNLAQVMRMTDAEAEALFNKVRWPETDGAPVCPHCGGLDAYECRRPNGAMRYRCKACAKDFTVTSGTLFASHKLPLRIYLAAIAIFCNEVKGKSALALSPRSRHVLQGMLRSAHKLREAMAEEMKGRIVGGDGKVAEVDGGYFGGYVEARELQEHRRDRRMAENQNGKRKVVVIVRERNGNSFPAVFARKAERSIGSSRAFNSARLLMPTKPPAWDRSASALRCAASITRKPIATDGLARIGRRNISAGYAARRSATITISPAPTCSATRKRPHGAKITAA